MPQLTLLNTSILTAPGEYRYKLMSVDAAREYVHSMDWQSAIGHDGTAAIISQLLDIECPVNRIAWVQEVGALGLVFKLRDRAPEGGILSAEEIEAIGYDFGLLVRTA